jgi:serine/threonine protein kinase
MSEHTDEGTMKGKLAYMSPERVQNDAFDARSDLYALGVVLWELLTRKQLFRGKGMVEIIKQVMEMPIAPPSSVRPDVPSALDAIALRALERDPAMRFPTAQAMADQLEEAVRATSYQSRMLPDLIYDLFGSGLQSSKIAMSGVTPELLAAAGASEIGTNGGSYRTSSARLARWLRRKTWRMAVGAGAVAIIAIVVLLALRPGSARVQVSQPSALATPTLAAPPAATPKTLTTVAAHPAPVMPDRPTETPPSRIKKGAVKKAKGSPGNNTSNPIADGLSIDPFAEAATRGQR